MKRLQKVLAQSLEFALIVLIGAMVLTVFAGVFTRFVLNSPLAWTSEVARYLLVYMTFLGGGLAVYEKRHIAVDFFLTKFTRGPQKILRLCTDIMMFVASGVLLYYGASFTWLARGTISPGLQQSMSWVYIAMPIMGIVMMLYLVPRIVEQVTNQNEESRAGADEPRSHTE